MKRHLQCQMECNYKQLQAKSIRAMMRVVHVAIIIHT